jgi:dihydrofolate reductase
MGRLVVSEFVTLDGVFEDPGGSEGTEFGGWAFQFERGSMGDEFKLDELRASEALLLGRVTYEGFARAWPAMEGGGEFGERMNSMAKYVVSSSLAGPEWRNSSVLDPSQLDGRVAQLKQELAGDILVIGSGRLVRALTERGLVDELRLMVYPLALGKGRRLFDGLATPSAFSLAAASPAGETLILTYGRAGERAAASASA